MASSRAEEESKGSLPRPCQQPPGRPLFLLQRTDGSRLTRPARVGTAYRWHAVAEVNAVCQAERVPLSALPDDAAAGSPHHRPQALGTDLATPGTALRRVADRLVCADLALGLAVDRDLPTLVSRVTPEMVRDQLRWLAFGRKDDPSCETDVDRMIRHVRLVTHSYRRRPGRLEQAVSAGRSLLATKTGKAAVEEMWATLCAGCGSVSGCTEKKAQPASRLRTPADVQKLLAAKGGQEEEILEFALLEEEDEKDEDDDDEQGLEEEQEEYPAAAAAAGAGAPSRASSFRLVLILGTRRIERALSEMAAAPPATGGLTSCRPALAVLMANLAAVRSGDVVLDPFVGTGRLLQAVRTFLGAAHCVGSDLQVQVPEGGALDVQQPSSVLGSASGTGTTCMWPPVDVVQADVLAPCFRGGGQCDAVLFDPPFGLRENLETGPASSSASRSSKTPTEKGQPPPPPNGSVHGDGPSRCYIQDHSGDELLRRVAGFVRPALELAAHLLPLGGRVAYLMPVFPSQRHLGLWPCSVDIEVDDADDSGVASELGGVLPAHPAFRLVSWQGTPCKKRQSMARLVVVMEKVRHE